MAYYEHPEATPPAHLLPAIAQALGLAMEELYGRSAPKRRLAKQEGDSRPAPPATGDREARR